MNEENTRFYEELKKRNNHFTYLFTFGPEFLGIINWLSHHENSIEKIRYSMYTEMAGSPGPITLQQSFIRLMNQTIEQYLILQISIKVLRIMKKQ